MSGTKILFICIANTCRSPMAEAMARELGNGQIEAFSAGLSPTGRVAQGSKAALAELGYGSEGLSSKGLHEVPLQEIDVVVSLIGPDGLRYLPPNLGATMESWRIRDPYGEDEEVYLASARTMETRIKRLLRDLGAMELHIS